MVDAAAGEGKTPAGDHHGAEQRDGDALASINQRIGARLVDWFLLLAAAVILGGFSAEENADAELVPPRWIVLVFIMAVMAYEAIPVAIWGQTLGKRIAGAQIVRLADGATPSPAQSLLRVAPVGMLMAVLGQFFLVAMVFVYFSAAFVSDRRGLLDRLAGTVVIRARPRS